MKNILITGGSGFIGSHLVEKLLYKGHYVTVIDNFSTDKTSNLEKVIDNSNLKIIDSDIRDLSKIITFFNKIDTVFHLAALAEIVPSIENPKDYYEIINSFKKLI